MTPPVMALSVGTRIGVHEIVARLGAGGMGEVYRARDTKLGRDVALKILLPSVAANADRVARFAREARLLASLNHPHIGAIYGFEDTGDVPALVLELVEGETLDDRVRRGPLPLSEALAVARQIADALDAAHAAGIIHRDLKPSNIKITPDGVVKVLDFGIAKALAADGSGPDSLTTLTMADGATIAGAILGTAAYMSPEQARGQPVDKRTDIWAFGCVLFEMLTGASAFVRDTVDGHDRRRRHRRTGMDVAPVRHARLRPALADALSPEGCQAPASRHRGRTDRARRRDRHARWSGSSADAATVVPADTFGAVAGAGGCARAALGDARQVRKTGRSIVD